MDEFCLVYVASAYCSIELSLLGFLLVSLASVFCFVYRLSIAFALYLISIVSPTTEFHFAMLVIKWEPRDVYLACALEDTRGHVQTTAVMFDHNVGVIRAIESLIRARLLYNLF